MSTNRLRLAAAIAVAAVLIASAGAVLGKTKEVAGTKHDVSSPGVSPCTYCHVPRDTQGALLWARSPNDVGRFSGLKTLCFSCHDGTVTTVGTYAFDAGRPQHLTKPGVKGQDCDRCHDPHEAGYGKFVKLPLGANLCQNCHERAGPTNHPVDVNAADAGIVPIDTSWDPYRGDFNGTRLWNIEGTGPGAYVKCLTCHSPHGGQPGTEINTVAFTKSRTSFLPLCQNCHRKQGGG